MASTRKTYEPSGRVNWGRLALWFILTLPLTLLGGLGLCLALHNGFYLVYLLPLLAGFPPAGAIYLTVWWSGCRNRWVGALAGLAAGLVAFVSYYQFDLAYTSGIGNLVRVDALPAHIEHRLATDEVKRVRPRARARKQAADEDGAQVRDVNMGLRWLQFLFDAACVGMMPAFAGWTRAGRPYSEKHQRWLHEHTVYVDPASAPDIAAALDAEVVEAFADAVVPIKERQFTNQGELKLHYIPYEPRTTVYLSLWIVEGKMMKSRWPQKFATMVRLTAEEAEALNAKVKLPGATIGQAVDDKRVGLERKAGAAATIEDLPADQAGTVLNGRNFAVLATIALAPLVLSVLIAIGIAIYVVLNWSDLEIALKVGAGVAALALMIGALAFTAVFGDYVPIYLQHHWSAAAVRKRKGALVDPDDEDAVFVNVVPRKNWGQLKLENAEDMGCVRIDRKKRVLLFEGDKQRWRIPADSILSCDIEEFCIGAPDPSEHNVFPLAVVKVNLGKKKWEAPLGVVNLTGRRQPIDARRKRCRQLRKKIRQGLLDAEA
jgi:hypothetical protein